MLKFLKTIAFSRVGHLLIVIHLCLVVYEFQQKPSINWADDSGVCYKAFDSYEVYYSMAGRYFHYSYESETLKTIVMFDAPAWFVAGKLTIPIAILFPDICVSTASWVAAILILICASVQWAIIGCAIEQIIFWRKLTERQ